MITLTYFSGAEAINDASRTGWRRKGSELQALLTEILGQGAVIQRTSGYIVQGVALKAQQATPHVATC